MATVSRPIIIESITLPSLLSSVIKSTTPVELIVCMPRDTFLEQLLLSAPPELQTPTLALLSSTSHISVSFCPTLPSLHAFLGSYSVQSSPEVRDETKEEPSGERTLAILYLVYVHADTASESAQGFSRTLASAVEAAIRSSSRLVLADPRIVTDADIEEGPAAEGLEEENPNPWDRPLAILNTTTSRFGGGKGWMGRTVSLKRVASRWFDFAHEWK